MHQSEWPPDPKRVIEDVKDYDQNCSTATQPIQHFKMLFSATGVVDSDVNIHQLDHPTVEAHCCTPERLVGVSTIEIERVNEPQESQSRAYRQTIHRPRLDNPP